MSSSYNRLLQIVPTPNRILEDCARVLDAFEAVFKNKGVILDQYGERKGRREVSKQDEEKQRGGSRKKTEYKSHDNLHSVVASVRTDFFSASKSTYEGSGVNVDAGDNIIGVEVQGHFDPDSSSVDISEL